MPRKKSTKPSKNGCSDDGFPPHLLRNYQNDASDALETLVPNAVFVARHAFSPKECQEWINYAEEGDRWDVVNHPASKWIAQRECDRIQKNDWHMSHRIYQRIESIVLKVSEQLAIRKYQPVTCNPNLRLYKYTQGQSFGRHFDDSNKIDLSGNASLSELQHVKDAQTEITVLFYLSSCRGGATRFHLPHGKSNGKQTSGGGSTGVAFTPEEGAVLLHVHGDHCLEHEAEPVLEGVKYVLRTDIVYGITK